MKYELLVRWCSCDKEYHYQLYINDLFICNVSSFEIVKLHLKKLCLYYYGLGFLFTTPKIRAFLLDSMREFLDELSKWGKELKK